MIDAREQFRDVILAAGLLPPDSIEPGRFHRFPGAGKRNGNTAGWCKLFSDERGGIYGDFSSGMVDSWHTEPSRSLTRIERERFREHVVRARAEAEAARREERAQATIKATAIWKAATPAPAHHAYLTRKGVTAHGVRLHNGMLTIPARDSGGELSSLQFIGPDGDKRFLTGGEIRGCYFGIGKPNGTYASLRARRPAGHCGVNSSKAEFAQVKPIDEDLDHANRILGFNLVEETRRQQRHLGSVLAFDESLHAAASKKPDASV